MSTENRRLILASGSPRRRELLGKMGFTFEICTPDVDEKVPGHASEVVRILAQRKGRAAARNYTDGVIIASDTLVSLHGNPLGKPENEDDARRMLRELSGQEHEIYSGVCVIDAATGREEIRMDRTGVWFKEATDEEINDYIATGEPMDKAGAYAIQGIGGKFVDRFVGSYENAVGFPVDVVRDMLSRFGF